MLLPAFNNSFASRKLIFALDTPSFQRDFAVQKTLNHGTGPDITFTRASGGTYFDSAGVLQTAGNNVPRFDHDPTRVNLLLHSEDLSNAIWNLQDATLNINEIKSPSGEITADKLIENTAVNGTHWVGRNFTVTANTAYTFSVFLKAAGRTQSWVMFGKGGSPFTRIGALVDLSNGTVSALNSGTPTTVTTREIRNFGDGWYRVELGGVFDTSSTDGRVEIRTYRNGTTVYTGDGTSGLYIWGAQLQIGSTATTYLPTTTTVAAESRGLLIEEARTNLLVRSAEFDNASWIKSNASITANSISSPSGTNTADILVEDTSVSAPHLVGVARTASNETVTLSVFAKAKERTNLLLEFSNFFNSVTNARFDLSSGTASSPVISGADYTGVSSSIANIGGGWYRCVLTATKGNVNTDNVARILLHNGTSGVYTGDGTSGLYIWGAQLEAGAFPTSYIPTTNAAATRSADSAVVTPISSFYNQSEGTLFAEVSRPQVVKNVTFMAFIDGTDANKIATLETGVAGPTQQRFQVVDGSAIALLLHGTAGVANTVYKMIGTYAANDFIAAQNGVLTSADTSGTTPTTMTRLSIGLATTDTNAGYSNSAVHIRKIAYYPKRLSNTLLQNLTA